MAFEVERGQRLLERECKDALPVGCSSILSVPLKILLLNQDPIEASELVESALVLRVMSAERKIQICEWWLDKLLFL